MVFRTFVEDDNWEATEVAANTRKADKGTLQPSGSSHDSISNQQQSGQDNTPLQPITSYPAGPTANAREILQRPFLECLNYFQCTRLSLESGEDFGYFLVRLEAAHVSLLRWGDPLGLLGNDVDTRGSYEVERFIRADEILVCIKTQFEMEKKLVALGKDPSYILKGEEDTKRLDESIYSLILRMRAIKKQRQEFLNLTQEGEVVLYGKSQASSLITYLESCIDKLEECFPSNTLKLKELLKIEICGLSADSIRYYLANVLQQKSQDEILRERMTGNGNHARIGKDYQHRFRGPSASLGFKSVVVSDNGLVFIGHVFMGKNHTKDDR